MHQHPKHHYYTVRKPSYKASRFSVKIFAHRIAVINLLLKHVITVAVITVKTVECIKYKGVKRKKPLY